MPKLFVNAEPGSILAAWRTQLEGFFPLLKKYGGAFITYDDGAFTLEVTSPRTGRSYKRLRRS